MGGKNLGNAIKLLFCNKNLVHNCNVNPNTYSGGKYKLQSKDIDFRGSGKSYKDAVDVALSPWEAWNDTELIERLESDWTLEDWK